jgi:hypothetical protein
MSSSIRYRIVSDYGYGDKSWDRGLTEEEVIKKFSICVYTEFKTIKECLNYDHYIHSVEEDDPEDEEDWDWMYS